jgi:hypothetical protein
LLLVSVSAIFRTWPEFLFPPLLLLAALPALPILRPAAAGFKSKIWPLAATDGGVWPYRACEAASGLWGVQQELAVGRAGHSRYCPHYRHNCRDPAEFVGLAKTA